MRIISGIEAKALKTTTHRAMRHVGGPEGFQHDTRVGQSQLSKYGSTSVDHATSFLPIDIALELDRAAGFPFIAAELARLQGFKIVQANGAPIDKSEITHRDISELGAEFADVQRKFHEALENGKIEPHEKPGVFKEIDELKAVLANIEQRLRADGVADD